MDKMILKKKIQKVFSGNTLKLVNKEIIVSYAGYSRDVGVVYQADGYILACLQNITNWTIEGNDKHYQTITDKYSLQRSA
jgi:hypothetical protein